MALKYGSSSKSNTFKRSAFPMQSGTTDHASALKHGGPHANDPDWEHSTKHMHPHDKIRDKNPDWDRNEFDANDPKKTKSWKEIIDLGKTKETTSGKSKKKKLSGWRAEYRKSRDAGEKYFTYKGKEFTTESRSEKAKREKTGKTYAELNPKGEKTEGYKIGDKYIKESQKSKLGKDLITGDDKESKEKKSKYKHTIFEGKPKTIEEQISRDKWNIDRVLSGKKWDKPGTVVSRLAGKLGKGIKDTGKKIKEEIETRKKDPNYRRDMGRLLVNMGERIADKTTTKWGEDAKVNVENPDITKTDETSSFADPFEKGENIDLISRPGDKSYKYRYNTGTGKYEYSKKGGEYTEGNVKSQKAMKTRYQKDVEKRRSE